MQKAGLLLGVYTQACKSVKTASSGMARREPLANKDGAHVVVSSRKQQNVDRAVATLQGEGLSVTGTVCHVGKAEDRERLVATALNLHGGIDILISNAAVSPFFGSLLDATEDVWDKVLDINVKAAALMTKAVVPEMEKRGGGSVVIVASIGAYSAFPGLGPYNVSKTALLGLTKNLALELAQRNIRVNCLAPGLIKTNFSRLEGESRLPLKPRILLEGDAQLPPTPPPSLSSSQFPLHPSPVQTRPQHAPFLRIGKPEECAGVVSFLCSEDASYITGETVVVAGGTPSHL
ncbi:LOW QUALITY PROTEIN: hypothetical protein MC885_010076 [Smutsia gigantea]|nr:LOW QUALITY PROTEIN: hypothetical protein MC885_010076 [Smutsia gigantea]